jgi:hypothetical protein
MQIHAILIGFGDIGHLGVGNLKANRADIDPLF